MQDLADRPLALTAARRAVRRGDQTTPGGGEHRPREGDVLLGHPCGIRREERVHLVRPVPEAPEALDDLDGPSGLWRCGGAG